MRGDPVEGPARLPSGRHDIPRDVVVQSQRTRIVQAMMEACAERGYAATTIAHVIERAGVSSATFYQLFRDKEACLLAGGQDFLADVLIVVRDAYGAAEDEIEKLRGGIAAILLLLSERPAEARVTLLEARVATPRSLETYRSGESALMTMMERSLMQSAGAGIRPSTAARAALGGAETIVRTEIAAGHFKELPELLERLMYCVLVPYLGQEKALYLARGDRERAPAPGS